MTIKWLFWMVFGVFVLGVLALDLGVFHRRAHTIHLKEAIARCLILLLMALLFNLGIYWWMGAQNALEFLTAYLIELSLSMDNVFVFLLIFTYFRVPAEYQPRVLLWGVLGALVMRAIFIATGLTLVKTFHWAVYLFGAFLLVSGISMIFRKDKKIHPERNLVLRLSRKFIRMSDNYEDGKFFVRKEGILFASPLFIVLLAVESTDVVFAVDSIPAVLAITYNPFIVYTSNIFAILGLRALYFSLAGIIPIFHYLHHGLAVILAFVGVKMLIADLYKIPIGIALGCVAGVLVFAVIASIIYPIKPKIMSSAACGENPGPARDR